MGERDAALELIVEAEGVPPAVLGCGGASLVAFMSFCVFRGFGAQHPAVALAERLEALGVRIGPLTLFYGSEAEDAEDAEKIGRTWQEAGELVEALEQAVDALRTDGHAQALIRRAGMDRLEAEMACLLGWALEVAAEGRRLRLLYRD